MGIRASSTSRGPDLFDDRSSVVSLPRVAVLSVEISSPRGIVAVTVRLRHADLSAFLGTAPATGLGGMACEVPVTASFTTRGVSIRHVALDAGGTVARSRPLNDGDWVLGPITLPRSNVPDAIAESVRHDVLPLTWRAARGRVRAGVLEMPDLASCRAEVCGAALDAVVARAQDRGASVAHASFPPAERQDITAGRGGTRRIRVRLGTDGRVGLTLDDGAMASLWSGRPDVPERGCRLVGSEGGLILLPSDDPAGAAAGGVPLVLRPSASGRWSGRTGRPGASGTHSLPLPTRLDGAGVPAEIHPGRVVLRGGVPAAPPHPAAFRLARARRLISEGMALVMAARAHGEADIEILDADGARLLALPREATAARIRVGT